MPGKSYAQLQMDAMQNVRDLQKQHLDDGLNAQLQALKMKQSRYNGFAAEMRNLVLLRKRAGTNTDYRQALEVIAELAQSKDDYRTGQVSRPPRISTQTAEKILSLLTSPGTTLASNAVSLAQGRLAAIGKLGNTALATQDVANSIQYGPIGSTLKSEFLLNDVANEVLGSWTLSTVSIISEICKYVPSAAGFATYFSPFSLLVGHAGPVGSIAIRYHTINKLYTLLAIYGQNPARCGCINHSIPKIISHMEEAIKDKALGLHSGYGTYQSFKALWNVLLPKRFNTPGHAGPGDSAHLPSGPEEWALPPSDPSIWASDLIAAAQLEPHAELISLEQSNCAIMAMAGHHTLEGGCPVALLALAALYGNGKIEKGRGPACATAIAGQSSLGRVQGLVG